MTNSTICIIRGLKHRKSRALYDETDQHVQKWIKTLHIAVLIVAPALFVLPPAIASFFAYSFTASDGKEAFQLPLPMWYRLVV